MTDPNDTERQERRRRINAEAAAWHLRFRNGIADEGNSDYLDWLAASPDHGAAMQRARNTWDVFGDHAAAPEVVKARRDALDRSGKFAARRWAVFRSVPRPAKAMAAVVMLAAVAIPAILFWQQADNRPVNGVTAVQVFETDIGETRVVTLSDNSRVSLDAFTRLKLRYTENERDIELERGQAHFDVATDPTRPFRVKAGDQVVTATGTAFNVELVGDDVLVTLLEGEVVVTEAPAAQRTPLSLPADVTTMPVRKLKPGQLLVASASREPQIVDEVNIQKTNAWRDGKVFLEGDSLPVAVARINRYSRIKLSVADDSLEVLRISGVFNAGDTEAFVEAVEAYFEIDARRMTSSRIELHPR